MTQANKITAQGLALAAIFFGLWSLITFVIPDDFTYDPQISVETEEKIGNKLTEVMLESQQEITDPQVMNNVKTIARRVKTGIKNSRYRYKFHVVRSKEINAFTLPGGNIIIYSSLIELTDNPGQLASVIAHEMGHAEKRHVVTRLIKEFGIAAIAGIVMNDKSGTVMQILRHIISTSFDRDQEREADAFALQTMAAAHIHPHHFSDFFEKLTDKTGSYGNTAEILMNHPDNDERIKSALNYKLPASFTETPIDDVDYKALKELVEEGI